MAEPYVLIVDSRYVWAVATEAVAEAHRHAGVGGAAPAPVVAATWLMAALGDVIAAAEPEANELRVYWYQDRDLPGGPEAVAAVSRAAFRPVLAAAADIPARIAADLARLAGGRCPDLVVATQDPALVDAVAAYGDAGATVTAISLSGDARPTAVGPLRLAVDDVLPLARESLLRCVAPRDLEAALAAQRHRSHASAAEPAVVAPAPAPAASAPAAVSAPAPTAPTTAPALQPDAYGRALTDAASRVASEFGVDLDELKRRVLDAGTSGAPGAASGPQR